MLNLEYFPYILQKLTFRVGVREVILYTSSLLRFDKNLKPKKGEISPKSFALQVSKVGKHLFNASPPYMVPAMSEMHF